MRYVSFKDGVRFKRWTPFLNLILDTLHIIQNKYDWVPDLVVTSVNDSTHMVGSRHYSDEAIDLRSKNFQNVSHKAQFVAILRVYLDMNTFTILFENEGEVNEHFHIQVRKGVTL